MPWPPSVNTYWRHTLIKGQVRTLLSKKGRQYRKQAAAEMLAQGVTFANLKGRIAVQLKAYPPDRRDRDLDNLPKSILDALTHAKVWADDSQVDDLRITRHQVVKGGAVVVTLTPVN